MKRIVSLALIICTVCAIPLSMTGCGLFMSAEERTLAVAEDLRANSTGEFLFMKKNPRENESYVADYISVFPHLGSSLVRAHKSLYEKYGIDSTISVHHNPFDPYFVCGDALTTHGVEHWPDSTTFDLPSYVTQFRTSEPSISVYGISVGLKDINVRSILETKGFSLASTYECHAFTVTEKEGEEVVESFVIFKEEMTYEEAVEDLFHYSSEYSEGRFDWEFHHTRTCEKYSNNGINITVYYSEDGEITEMFFLATTTRNNPVDY